VFDKVYPCGSQQASSVNDIGEPQNGEGLPDLSSVPLNRLGRDRDCQRRIIRRIIASYDDFIIRWYCRIRFIILRLRFLEEIDQYIPRSGRILDVGCGFGLFSLFFASRCPCRELYGFDVDAERIATASHCASLLGLTNAHYEVGDAAITTLPDGLACIYTLDLLHHLPPGIVVPLLHRMHAALADAGILIIKDVDTRPVYKRTFTLALDRLMVGMEPIRYWSVQEMLSMLAEAGFAAHTHAMRDILPYPHRLYICRKQ
jgi:SAM-dependent methyltransferase